MSIRYYSKHILRICCDSCFLFHNCRHRPGQISCSDLTSKISSACHRKKSGYCCSGCMDHKRTCKRHINGHIRLQLLDLCSISDFRTSSDICSIFFVSLRLCGTTKVKYTANCRLLTVMQQSYFE